MYPGRARRKAARAGALMAIMALLPPLPGGTDQGLGGGDSDGVNGSYELGYMCADSTGGLALAVVTLNSGEF